MASSMSGVFQKRSFQELLQTNDLGRCFIFREVTDSTARIAAQEAEDGCSHGTLVVAEQETERADSHGFFFFTLVLRLGAVAVDKLPLACLAAVVWTIRQFGLNAWISWPSAVCLGGGKQVAVLKKNAILSSYQSITIGINISTSDSTSDGEGAERCSLSSYLTSGVHREVVLSSVCNRLESLLNPKMQDDLLLLTEYRSYLGLLGHQAEITLSSSSSSSLITRQTGVIVGIDDHGQLVARIDGVERTFSDDGTISVQATHPVAAADTPAVFLRPFDPVELINGAWKNQVGSIVHLTAKPDGSLTGGYQTAVGSAEPLHQLFGTWCSTIEQRVLVSFSVAWAIKNATPPRSTTAWSGQVQPNQQPPVLITTWMQTSSAHPGEEWRSVRTNKSTFVKIL